jgi:methylisocitrate lyase
LARTAWAATLRAATSIADSGTFDGLGSGYPAGELNRMFSV